MGIQGLDWQTIQIALSGGLSQKGNAQAINAPAVSVLRDAEFDDLGGLRTRKPYTAMSNAIDGGGTIANARRLVANGDELVLFTGDSLYSWSPQKNAWVLRDEHLAVAVDETDAFAINDDQVNCDRAQIGNVIIYAFVTKGGSGGAVYLAARDATTGTTIMAPTLADPGFGSTTCKLVQLDTRVLLFWVRASSLEALSIDPSNVAGSIVTPTFLGTMSTTHMDVVKVPNADQAVIAYDNGATYLVKRLSNALAVLATAAKARNSDGAIAVSVEPTSTNVQVIRANGTALQGDFLLVSTLADVTINQAIGTLTGTIPQHVTCCHRSAQTGGAYRCYVFWSRVASGSLMFSNWVDTAGAIGTAAAFNPQIDIASRAFDHGGRIFLWCVFALATNTGFEDFGGTKIQNVNLLYRDDGVLISQCLPGRSGGYLAGTVLPAVTTTNANTYAFCGTARRIVNIGDGGKGYSARSPIDIGFTFDDNRARQTVRVGKTMYISGGLVQQYDGLRIVEVGFVVAPNFPSASIGPNSGAIEDGTYAYKWTYRWTNAQGEVDRSSSPTVNQVVVFGHSSLATIDESINPLTTTKKVGFPVQATVIPATAEAWRTLKNPAADAPFYLVTSQDPSVTSGTNFYVPNNVTLGLLPNGAGTAMRDALADSALAIRQSHPENDAVLENLAPPPGRILIEDGTRVFIAGIPEFPDEVWYSKQRSDAQVVSFNDSLRMVIPTAGGDITALAIAHETLYVFRETAIYAMPGDGFANNETGQNYGPYRQVSVDVGAISQDTIDVGPFGVVFKSLKGWQVLGRDESVKYVGGDVVDFDSDTIGAVDIVKAQHQVRIVATNARMLVWDYLVDRWAEWTVPDAIDACVWRNQYVYLSATGPKIEAAVSGATYGIDMETAWIKVNDLQGSGRVRRALLIGLWKSACNIRIRTAYDYEADGAGGWLYRDDAILDPNNTLAIGAAFQVKRGFSQQQCEAVKLRITAVISGDLSSRYATMTTASMALLTSGANWAATLKTTVVGLEGNAVTLNIFASEGTAVEIRDHMAVDDGGWFVQPWSIGIRCGTDCTVAQLEAAIGRSKLAAVTVHAPNQTSVITNVFAQYSKTFSGGASITPTGECVSLSGLALEVGVDKTLNRRIAALQKG